MSGDATGLTDRQKAALAALAQAKAQAPGPHKAVSPARVARLCGDKRRSASGWRNTLGALERRGLAKTSYMHTHGYTPWFEITEKGEEALRP